jgi:hypothetical protein
MKFNIVLGNHPPLAINTTRDHTLIIRGGLEEAGHFAQLSMSDVFHDEINVFYDFFNADSCDYFRFLRFAGYEYGLITTEILKDGFLNYRDDNANRLRIEALKEIAPHARFVWVMHEPSLESYRTLSGHDRCYVLPLGYSRSVQELRRLPYDDRDIDFLFFGLPTPYRQSLLGELADRGFVSRHIYDVPGFIRNSVIERTKINLSLRQNENWDQPSVGRISYLVSNRCALIIEQTANGRPYEDYAVTAAPDAFVESCVETISNNSFQELAEQYAEAFKNDFPMNEIMTRLLQKTFGTS